jgi:hypothetical protein
MMHLLAATEAAAFSKEVRHGAILFLVLRNLPLKQLVADALGEIELMACSKNHGSDFVTFAGHPRMSGLSRDSPTKRGYYAESSQARTLTIGDLGHSLHISTFCT